MEGHPRFGRFRALECLGTGSMGAVYRVIDPENDQQVALKTLHATSPDDVYRLKREFRALSALAHPNLVELYELFSEPECAFFTMELVRGRPATHYVWHGRDAQAADAESGRSALRRLERVLRQLVAGLRAVHDAGHVHRDVKPSNILVSSEGRLVLLDFGLSGLLETKDWFPTEHGMVSGTLPYMSPEQLAGHLPTASMDWYATGVLLYEMLTGRLPFDGPVAEVIEAKERRRFAVDSIPEDFRELTVALLEPSPDRRADSGEILTVLERVTGRAATASPPPTTSEVFCGRQPELEKLRGIHDAVEPERPALVRIVGPSGIGKTRLIEHFLETVRGETLVFRGRCHPKESLPYKALDQVVDEVSRYLLSLPENRAAGLTPRHVTALVRLFPVLGRVTSLAAAAMPEQVTEPKELRRRGFAALRELFARIADRIRVLVWIDDAHWADEDSGQLLADLLRPPDAPGVLIVLSQRSDHDGEEQVLDDLTGDELRVGALPRDDLHELARLLIGQEGARLESEIDQIAAEADGSPFLVCELVGHLRTAGATHRDLSAHDRLTRLTLDRADALPEEAREILDLVSIAGGPVEMAVVLAAMEHRESGRSILSLLSRRFLVRETALNHRPALAPSHDRVREAITAHMPAERAREYHARLAVALEHSDAPEPEALAHHFHEAGHDTRAADYAVAAGDRAASALAFLRASEHYRSALEWRAGDRAWRLTIERRRADALVNAGRCADAASIYLGAAVDADPLESLDLRRLAFKHFFASGHLDEGVEVLRPLLAELKLSYPGTATRAVLETALRLGLLSVRSLRRPEGAPPSSTTDLFRIDVCDAASTGLVAMDAVRGVYFLFLGLSLARAHGEPSRYGKLLAGAGASVSLMAPKPIRRRGVQMLAEAESIAMDRADALVGGYVAAARGQIALARGAWSEALAQSDSASEQEQSRAGLTFERNVAHMASLRALEELGRMAEFEKRADRLHLEASRAGDRYGETTARLNLALVHLLHDRPAEAREVAEDILASWSVRGFHIQHLYAHRLLVHADLFEARPDAAEERVRDFWPRLESSGLLRVPLPGLDAALLRARVCVAQLAASRVETSRDASRLVAAVARAPRADAQAHGSVLEAALANAAGQTEEAARVLERAAAAFVTLEMPLAAAQARVPLAVMRGDDPGPTTAHLTELGVRAPERWLRFQTPGFSAPT